MDVHVSYIYTVITLYAVFIYKTYYIPVYMNRYSMYLLEVGNLQGMAKVLTIYITPLHVVRSVTNTYPLSSVSSVEYIYPVAEPASLDTCHKYKFE